MSCGCIYRIQHNPTTYAAVFLVCFASVHPSGAGLGFFWWLHCIALRCAALRRVASEGSHRRDKKTSKDAMLPTASTQHDRENPPPDPPNTSTQLPTKQSKVPGENTASSSSSSELCTHTCTHVQTRCICSTYQYFITNHDRRREVTPRRGIPFLVWNGKFPSFRLFNNAPSTTYVASQRY